MSAPRILVVEDNPPLRRMLAVTLRTAGYEVVEAGDGGEALKHAIAQAPALVVLDAMLPDAEPVTLLAQLRDRTRSATAPAALAISGSEERLAALRLADAGFDGFLCKPIEPARLLAAVAIHAPITEALVASRRGRRVLVADDEPVQRKLLDLQLTRRGFDVTLADGGATALALARATPPDMIVSDILMPDVDGFELCHAVRSDPALRGVPVVLISAAYVTAADRQLALRAGAGALVERTPDLSTLLETVDGCLGHSARPPAPTLDFPAEHGRRLRAQLDHQAHMNRGLREQASVTAADLSVLAGISSAVIRTRDRAALLAETLPRCLEAGGLAATAVWLRDTDDSLTEAATAGPQAELTALTARVTESLTHAPSTDDLFEPPAPDGGHHDAAVLCARLGTETAPLGWLAVAWQSAAVSDSHRAFTRAIAAQMSEGLVLERAFEDLGASRAETIARLALAIDSRDDETGVHTDRVSRLTAMLAERAGLPPERVELLRLASLLHDVGKIGVSDAILRKPGRLTEEEFEAMKRHTVIGHRILAASDIELLQVAATIALTHHERIDGGGYPHGLTGDEIPLEGRIVAVADVFEALTTDRVYRSAMSQGAALTLMRAQRGTHFDAALLDLFTASVAQLDAVG